MSYRVKHKEVRNDLILEALCSVSPDFVTGCFELSQEVIKAAPDDVIDELRNFQGWSAFVFGIPIKDQVLWVWHKQGDTRFLFANYILLKASQTIRAALNSTSIDSIDVLERFGESLAMVELGERAGLGTRGVNNLLLHPVHGAWLQVHALLINARLEYNLPLATPVCTNCGYCIPACPAKALEGGRFNAARCSTLVASHWLAKSKAFAVTADSYVECAECIISCPIGQKPEGIFEWVR